MPETKNKKGYSNIKKCIITILLSAAASCPLFAGWEPLTNGYWNVLLHLGADFDNDMLPSNGGDADVDYLLRYTGVSETNQFPYAGQTVSLPRRASNSATEPDNVARTDFVWTVVTNPASISNPNAYWTPSSKDYYIKYWHAYLMIPDGTNRTVRFRAISDDDLRVWVNGERKIAKGYDGNFQTYDVTLAPGVQSITIKLREGSGGDNMAIYMTDTDNVAFTDILFSLDAIIGAVPAPEVVALTEQTAQLASPFVNRTGAPVDFYVVYDTENRGDVLDDWVAAGADVLTYENTLSAPDAILLESLLPDTEYAVRLFVLTDTEHIASPCVQFTTYDERPVVEIRDATDIAGLTATANGELRFIGSDSASVDVTLYYGTTAAGDEEDPATWDGTPATITLSAPGPFTFPLSGLWYATEYRYRFYVENSEGHVWSDTATFTTLGTPIFGETSAAIPEPGALTVSAEILSAGPVPATVTCYFAEAGEPLAVAQTWNNVEGATNLAHTATGLQVGGEYRYAFSIYCEVDSATYWTVWSATNTFVTVGDVTWIAGGADTDWHTAANWDYGVPGPAANARFPAGGVTVTASRDVAVGSVDIVSGNTGAVTFDFDTTTLNAGTFTVGNGTVAAFVLASGTLDAGTFTVGLNAGTCAATLSSGSRLQANELVVGNGNNNRFTVGAGAELVVTGETTLERNGDRSGNELVVHGLFLANGINIGGGGGWGGQAAMTVDGGVVTNYNATYIGPWAGNGHSLTLRNAARLVQTAGTLKIGHRASNCRLEILDGSALELDGSITVNIGSDWGGNIGFITVSNATLRATGGITLGQANSGGNNTFLIYEDPGHTTLVHFGGNFYANQGYNGEAVSNNRIGIHGGTLAVGGTFSYAGTSKENLLHMSRPGARLTAAAINLAGTSHTFAYDLATDAARAQPLVEIAGNATFSEDFRVDINAVDFLGRATLMTAADIAAPVDENFTVTVAKDRGGKLSVTETVISLNAWEDVSAILVR